MGAWRTAATLILTAPTSSVRSIQPGKKVLHDCFSTNYGVLMLKRSSKSSFFPNTYVFPGGGLDQADKTTKWLDIFDTVDGNFVSNFDQLILNPSQRLHSPIMLLDAGDNNLPCDISYRICAIRETFEETGLLIARCKWKNNNEASDKSDNSNKFANIFEFTDSNTANYWREEVHADANAFLRLCKHFRCVPDIWCLYEWSNWLTPICNMNRPSRRYDTIFYKAALSSTLPDYLKEDNKEITKLTIKQPSEFLELYYNGKCQLGNPQVYELLRVINFNDHLDLIKFFVERGNEGLERYLPLIAITKDKIPIALYPGDDDYPFGMVQTGDDPPIQLKSTYDQISQEFKHRNFNRVSLGQKGAQIFCNVKMPFGHVKPVDTKQLFVELTARL